MEIRTIREALYYTQLYRNTRIVIKLGKKIINQAEELGITKDISQLKAMGISVVLAYSEPSISIANWIILQDIVRKYPRENLKKIERFIALGGVPMVYCPSKDGFTQDESIAKLAIALEAKKLIYVTDRDGVFDEQQQLIREMTTKQAQEFLEIPGLLTLGIRNKVKAAIMACKQGVPRVHIINGLRQGSLLKEIFSCEGIGTMIYRNPYQVIRQATVDDLIEIIDILKEAEFPFRIVFSDIKEKIETFLVFTVDREVHGCIMTTLHPRLSSMEVSYLTTSIAYENSDVPQRLIEKILEIAENQGLKYVFLQKEKNPIWLGLYPWFNKMGFRLVRSEKIELLKTEIGRKKIWLKSF